MSLSGGAVSGTVWIDNINLGSVPSGAPNRMAVEEEPESQVVEVFPNPSGSYVTIHKIPTDEGDVTIKLVGATGINFDTFKPTEGQTEMTISLEKYSTGLHFVNIQTEKSVQTLKLMILK